MKDPLWDLNKTWPVGRKLCRFTKCPPKKNSEALPKTLWRKNVKMWTTFPRLPHSTPHVSGTIRQTKMLASIYNNVYPKIGPTFRELWHRNGWDPFAYCDPPFGGHYVATIKVATCPFLFSQHRRKMSIYKCPKISGALPQKFKAQKHRIFLAKTAKSRFVPPFGELG